MHIIFTLLIILDPYAYVWAINCSLHITKCWAIIKSYHPSHKKYEHVPLILQVYRTWLVFDQMFERSRVAHSWLVNNWLVRIICASGKGDVSIYIIPVDNMPLQIVYVENIEYEGAFLYNFYLFCLDITKQIYIILQHFIPIFIVSFLLWWLMNNVINWYYTYCTIHIR